MRLICSAGRKVALSARSMASIDAIALALMSASAWLSETIASAEARPLRSASMLEFFRTTSRSCWPLTTPEFVGSNSAKSETAKALSTGATRWS